MSRRGRVVVALVVVAVALAAPSLAFAHAYLIKTVPTPGAVLDSPPRTVALTFDEAVEPRFAIISVTDANGRQKTTGSVTRSPSDPATLVVPLRPHLPKGWYLVYWRAISVDGHPVQGAFTYAVGPNPGPAPKFAVPSVSGSATSLDLLITRWVMLLSVMVAIGLFAFRVAIARPVVRRLGHTPVNENESENHSHSGSRRAVSVAFVIASVIGVIAIPVYLDFATASDSLRSVFDVTALVPLFRVTAFGRGYVDMLICFALFAVAAWISLYLDRPDRELRSVAEIVAQTGALLAAAAVLVIPGTAGHAGQTSPRGLAVPFDWLHLISGSLWLGGLVGLLVLWLSVGRQRRVPALTVVVPRFSNVALISVLVLLGTGTGATIIHMPAVDALWDTSYGVAILVKIGILIAALSLAAGNLLRTRPRLIAAGELPARAGPAARLLRRLISGETFLVASAVFVAAVLSSLAPPPPTFALQNSALAHVGPGRVAATVHRAGYRLQVLVSPNKAAAPDSFALRITKNGRPVRHASVTLTFNHTEMQMPQQEYQLKETRPGVYSRAAPALIMVGKWSLAFNVTPKTGAPFTALILDQANG
jgi:copper transport protein